MLQKVGKSDTFKSYIFYDYCGDVFKVAPIQGVFFWGGKKKDRQMERVLSEVFIYVAVASASKQNTLLVVDRGFRGHTG